MASIFTFDPDPPRVSSPWHRSARGSPRPESKLSERDDCSDLERGAEDAAEHGVTRLEAEPQEGPTEYKLHLLLRPRRSFTSSSTARQATGSHPPKQISTTPRSVSESSLAVPQPLSHSSNSRQHRLEQLTTQLLWRLQQSSPYHASASDNLILPTLPEANPTLESPNYTAKLVPGLEESNGALYEIGVSDDGTFVGLTEDEMEESLNNLRAMAASLGCSVKVLRMVPIGECEWFDAERSIPNKPPALQKGSLFVAEAYIKPEPDNSNEFAMPLKDKRPPSRGSVSLDADLTTHPNMQRIKSYSATAQLRVSLTGATKCGKSSLLGTLSTSTLDNGRGKSRLSLLKHRHEIASGMTSSVAQELIGYADSVDNGQAGRSIHVINYATGNVSSWTDIHSSATSGRVAFLSDSAGHPRYRRTTVRGLVTCVPHWTILCIAATNDSDPFVSSSNPESEAEGTSSFAGASAHLSMVHLDLCMRLRLPLVVVITKVDAANKLALREILSALLSTLKAAGRKPLMLSNDNKAATEVDLQHVQGNEIDEVGRFTDTLKADAYGHVPIVFTSAVNGIGISKLHGLLRMLPVPQSSPTLSPSGRVTQIDRDSSSVVYHIDDVFKFPINTTVQADASTSNPQQGSVISGYLEHGHLSVGDRLMLGPFSYHGSRASEGLEGRSPKLSEDTFLTPRSFTDALAKATASPKVNELPLDQEWQEVKILSIRNLRLPVRVLEADQVGTIGVVPVKPLGGPGPLPIRKGMVLVDGDPQSVHSFTALFNVEDASSFVVGSHVVLYIASVRAAARVIAIALQNDSHKDSQHHSPDIGDDDSDGGFAFRLDEDEEPKQKHNNNVSILVTFKFTTYKEWLEGGAQVLVMPGGGAGFYQGSERGAKGVGGLEGFVGRVVESFT